MERGGFVMGQGWNDHHHTDGSSLRTYLQSSHQGTRVIQSNVLSGTPRTIEKPSAANFFWEIARQTTDHEDLGVRTPRKSREKRYIFAPCREGPPETEKQNRPLPQVGSGTTGIDRRPADGGR
jgi:hypothetical protein